MRGSKNRAKHCYRRRRRDVPLALEVEVATIRLRFGGGHGRRRRIGLQYRKSLANQLAPRYARNSAAPSPSPRSMLVSLSRAISLLVDVRSMIDRAHRRVRVCVPVFWNRKIEGGQEGWNTLDWWMQANGCHASFTSRASSVVAAKRANSLAAPCYAPFNGPRDIRSCANASTIFDERPTPTVIPPFYFARYPASGPLDAPLEYQPRDMPRKINIIPRLLGVWKGLPRHCSPDSRFASGRCNDSRGIG